MSNEELSEEAKEDFSEARDVDELRRRVGTVQDGAKVTLNWEGSSDLGLSILIRRRGVVFLQSGGIGRRYLT